METLESVQIAARDRLYPSLRDPSWLVLRRRRELFEKWISLLNAHDLRVLDVGGRVQPYRPLLEARVRHYVAIDLLGTPVVDIQARGEQLPFSDEKFDLVICTQVLEYAPKPENLIAEIHRVLKPCGYLFLSAPAASVRDSDVDCWRFLPAGLEKLLISFSDVEVAPEGSSIVGLFRAINSCLDIFVRYPALRTVFRYTLCPLVNLFGEFADRVAGSKNDQFAANYSVCARK